MKWIVVVFLLVCVSVAYGKTGGGISVIDVNDEGVQKAALIATTTLTQWKNSPNHQQLVKVKSAKVQVVAGLLYHLEIEIQDSGCPKSSPLDGCDAEPLDRFEVCALKVLSQPWLEVLEVKGEPKCYPVYH